MRGEAAGVDAGKKRYTHGTHRVCPPEETLERLRPHLATMGITRVANVTGLDRTGVPVVMVVRPNARSVAVSQGKGLTLAAAPRRSAADPGARSSSGGAPAANVNATSLEPPRLYPRACWRMNRGC